MQTLHLVLLAALQGVTELFPISSLGHSVLVPALFHWPLDRNAGWFLPFVVVLHLGTAAALLIYFWRDWTAILGGTWRARGRPSDPSARLFWMLVLATIPAGLLGLAFEHRLRLLFGAYAVVAISLILNGVMLVLGDQLVERTARHKVEEMGWLRALGIGFAQCLALIPGMSRSGATLVAGLASGLDHEDSARFSFLLATPIIGAAGVLEVPKLLHHQGAAQGLLPIIMVSGVVAGVFAYLSTRFLMRYFHGHEVKALRPFGIYCIVFGAVALLLGAGP